MRLSANLFWIGLALVAMGGLSLVSKDATIYVMVLAGGGALGNGIRYLTLWDQQK